MPQIVWTVAPKLFDSFYNQKGVDCLFSLRVTEQIRFVTNFLLGTKLSKGENMHLMAIGLKNFWPFSNLSLSTTYETEILIVCFAAQGLARVLYGLVSETCHLHTECLSELIFFRRGYRLPL